jgi:hypothetical protein
VEPLTHDVGQRTLVERERGHGCGEAPVDEIRNRRAPCRIDDAVQLVEIGVDESAAEARPVEFQSAAVCAEYVFGRQFRGPEERHVEVPAREHRAEQIDVGNVHGLHLDTDMAELRLDELERTRPARAGARRGQEPKPKPPAPALVDQVGATATARRGEQSPRLGGTVPIDPPVRPVRTLVLEMDRVVEHTSVSPEECADEGHPIDAVRERAPDAPVPQGRMPTRTDAKLEMLPGAPFRREELESAFELARWLRHYSKVELAGAQRLLGVRSTDEAQDDAIDVGRVAPPVARVADEYQLLATLPGSDEEGPAADGLARLRVDDPVAPEIFAGGEVLTAERVPREGRELQEQLPVAVA